MLISDHIDNTWSVDLSSEYKTYSGLICVVKHAIYVIGIRRINPYICKPDWCDLCDWAYDLDWMC